MVVMQVKKQLWKQTLVSFLLNLCFTHCLSKGKELTFTDPVIMYDVQLVCHMLYISGSIHLLWGVFWYICVHVHTLHLYTCSYTPYTKRPRVLENQALIKNEQTSEVRVSLQP